MEPDDEERKEGWVLAPEDERAVEPVVLLRQRLCCTMVLSDAMLAVFFMLWLRPRLFSKLGASRLYSTFRCYIRHGGRMCKPVRSNVVEEGDGRLCTAIERGRYDHLTLVFEEDDASRVAVARVPVIEQKAIPQTKPKSHSRQS